MDEQTWQVEQFERHRAHLQRVAYRMLGSVSEAEDAVQEAWLRLSRSDTERVDNLGGWLTTVVGRVCLDMLRARRARPEESAGWSLPEPVVTQVGGPEEEALLADSVGLALLVVLETLSPAERLAFVLHDMFGVPFDEIATIVGRTPAAARQLASRAGAAPAARRRPTPTWRISARSSTPSWRRRARGISTRSWRSWIRTSSSAMTAARARSPAVRSRAPRPSRSRSSTAARDSPRSHARRSSTAPPEPWWDRRDGRSPSRASPSSAIASSRST